MSDIMPEQIQNMCRIEFQNRFCHSLWWSGEDYKGQPTHRKRDVWVMRVETDFWDAEESWYRLWRGHLLMTVLKYRFCLWFAGRCQNPCAPSGLLCRQVTSLAFVQNQGRQIAACSCLCRFDRGSSAASAGEAAEASRRKRGQWRAHSRLHVRTCTEAPRPRLT